MKKKEREARVGPIREPRNIGGSKTLKVERNDPLSVSAQHSTGNLKGTQQQQQGVGPFGKEAGQGGSGSSGDASQAFRAETVA
ncbi:hypothetical protein NEUTE2DRAFT_70145 [Neurospora tetrasperma FGSC 2509]|nr:hypothetical protein NEUTE2DRAFT_70145 [Neurospora tetrasperma FGSC 2509]